MLDDIDLEAGTVTAVCPCCGAATTSPLADLTLGNEGNADGIALPPCVCGAQTVLFRTWETNVDSPHRRAVNALSEYLKQQGQSHKAQAEKHREEKESPPLIVDIEEVKDVSGRVARREGKRAAWIIEATKRVIIRLGLDEGERPPADAVEKEFQAIVEAADGPVEAVAEAAVEAPKKKRKAK